jgi:tetrapyrrole methylase family protein/MazG family protein/ATP diphosphatase
MSLPPFDENQPRPVPSIDAQDGKTLERLVGVMRRLLSDDGCPWDREQTFESLKKYVLEEACEVIDAIEEGSRPALREELGDLLLQVVFQAELARREGAFAIDDVVTSIVDKLVHRHPHVFAVNGQRLSVKDADEVLSNWEKLKAKEKAGRPLLAGVPKSLPALARAQRIGEWGSIGPRRTGLSTRFAKKSPNLAPPWRRGPPKNAKKSWGTCSLPS